MRHMISLAAPTIALLASLLPAEAQNRPAPPADAPETPESICGPLIGFVESQGGQVAASQTTIEVDQLRAYQRTNNLYACRQAIAQMEQAGVPLPADLRAAIGQKPGSSASQPPR